MNGRPDSTGQITALFAAWRQLGPDAREAVVALAELVADPAGETRALLASWRQLAGDERAVLLALAKRLVAGRALYGQLELEHDQRDFLREASEELLDATVYLTIDVLRRARAASGGRHG